MYRHIIICLIFYQIHVGFSNLIRNGNFDEPLDAGDWICHGKCSIERTNIAYQGNYSVRVFNRKLSWSSLRQDVPVVSGGSYFLTAMVKLDNLYEDSLYHQVQVKLKVKGRGKKGRGSNRNIAIMPYMTADQGWRNISTVFKVDGDQAQIAFRVDHEGVTFHIDSVSMVPIPHNDQWKEEANKRIEAFRKGGINIKVNVSDTYDPEKIVIKLAQLTHAFPFGSVTHAEHVYKNDRQSRLYRDYLYDMFNMAVIADALKWKSMEKQQDNIRFWRVDRALEELEKHNMPVKGHCITWGVEDNVPTWLVLLNGTEVEFHTNRRFNYLLNRYANKFSHWDILNEHLHGSFFENKTRNMHILRDMLVNTTHMDPNAKLFLNDFQLVNGEQYTGAMVDEVIKLKEQSAPVYGIGVQSHYWSQEQMNIDIITKRLDILASANLPLWISELDVSMAGRDERADRYEDILRLYFSYPAIEGIILWGFWNESHWRPDAALVEGDNLVENAAGERIRQLWKEDWFSKESFHLESREKEFYWRAFHGDYKVSVIYNDRTIQDANFHLGKDHGILITIDI